MELSKEGLYFKCCVLEQEMQMTFIVLCHFKPKRKKWK